MVRKKLLKSAKKVNI